MEQVGWRRQAVKGPRLPPARESEEASEELEIDAQPERVLRTGAVFQAQPELRFADFCSGIRAPLSYALAWCGWTVETFDIELGTDLAADQHDAIWNRRGSFLARSWACPCSTFSKAREKRLAYSADGGPPQLRSEQYPKGLPGLKPSVQQRVDTDTTLACRAAQWAEHSLEDGLTLTLVENPRNSLLWALPEQQAEQP